MDAPEQVSTVTRLDRYPEIFSVARAAAGPDPERILSYGCSTGEEPLTLAQNYFPGSQILGVDVSDEALARARIITEDVANVRIARSGRQTIAEAGPYDIIFAMSVLCRNPLPKDHREVFPFVRFEHLVAGLMDCLKTGGLLVIANANYTLTQSRLIRFFDLVADPGMRDPGQVWKLAFDGTVLEPSAGKNPAARLGTDCMFRKRADPWPDGPNVPLRVTAPDGAELVTIWLGNLPSQSTLSI